MVKDRATLGKAFLAENGLDALLFTQLSNIRYLSGFTGTDGVLVLTRQGDCFLTDSRYTAQARQQVCADDIREYRLKLDGVVDYLLERGVKRVGFESEIVSFGDYQRFKEKGGDALEWVPLGRDLRELRTVKESSEIALMESAAQLNAEAFESVLPQIAPGASEREIALALEFALKKRGGEEKAFDFIVASGERGAMPHGVASDKKLAKGELVTIDFGTRVGGYHSDETVTVALGEVTARHKEIYEVVLAAHDKAIERIRPGVSLREIDAIARDYISEKGYGDFFGHGLGHGVGLEIHEAPVLSSRTEDIAREGMVFTVEPGIYIPGFAGVRIEDTMLVTADGSRCLTQIPKKFKILPC